MNLIPWNQLTQVERDAVRAFQIDERQGEYAGPISRAIAAVESATTDEVIGMAFEMDAVIVGFVVLKSGASAPTWAGENTIVISAMRIDAQYQGRGFGTLALNAVATWVHLHMPLCTSIKLSVDEENIAGIRAYTKAGFVDDGIRETGRIGWVRYMTKSIVS